MIECISFQDISNDLLINYGWLNELSVDALNDGGDGDVCCTYVFQLVNDDVLISFLLVVVLVLLLLLFVEHRLPRMYYFHYH